MAADGSSPCSRSTLKRRPTYRALDDHVFHPPAAAGGSGAVSFFCAPAAGQKTAVDETSGRHHFLDACSLCKLPLRRSQDIYMCRGNVPFCSEECREKWMDVEETREEEERSYYRSISARAATAATAASTRKEQQGQKAASRIFHARASEAVAAS